MADQKKFADSEGFPYRLLSDPDKTAAAAYGAQRQEGEQYFEHGIPKRISYLVGPDGAIRQVYAKVVPAEHPDQVLGDLG